MLSGYSIVPIISATACLTIAFYEFLIMTRKRGRRTDFAFVLACVGVTAYNVACAGQYNVASVVESLPWLRAEAICLSLSGLAFLWYFHELTKAVPKWGVALCCAWLGLGSLSQIFAPIELIWQFSQSDPRPLFQLFGYQVFLYEANPGPLTVIQEFGGLFMLALLVWAVWIARNAEDRRSIRKVGWALFCVILAYLNDVLVDTGVYSFPYLIEYAWVAFLVFVGLQRSNQIIDATTAKAAVTETEEKLAAFIRASNEAIILVDAQGLVTEFNHAAEELYGFLAEEVKRKPAQDMIERIVMERNPGGTTRKEFLSQVMAISAGQTMQPVELTIERPDGTRREFLQNAFAIKTESGAMIGMISHDVTGIKRAEARLIESLQEKRVLIKEVHHRVKNNLQLISSLLYIQASRSKEPAFKTVLMECRNQIFSMALIHEDLYRSTDFSGVDFGQYAINLSSRLIGLYAETGPIDIDTDLDPIRLDINRSIPFGLILNELCTNSMKYAFPPGFAGKRLLTLSLKRQDNNIVRLEVRDSGVGLPESFDMGTGGSFGMELVTRLTRQLGGSISFKSDNGAVFAVEIPENPSLDSQSGLS